MADIDMIPRGYRDAQRLRAALRRFAVMLAAVLLAGAAAAGLLRWRAAHDAPLLAQMRAAAAAAGSDATRLARLQARQAVLEQSVTALAALRGTGAVGRFAVAVDGALGTGVALTAMRYTRSEQIIPAGAAPAQAGDVSMPATAGAAAAPASWRVTRRLDLAGSASDFPALTQFLRAFSAQPGIAEARLIDSVAPGGDSAAIGFNLTGVAAAPAGATP